jgi:hypothetical protein
MYCSDNHTNTIGNFMYTTPVPLQNESKHNDYSMKDDSPPPKVLSVLMIFSDF